MDGQCHRPRGTYLRHRRDGLHQQRQHAVVDAAHLVDAVDGLHQQRQHAAQTACPAPLQDIRG